MKKEIFIDARMAFSSGIGTYIRSLVRILKNEFSIRLIVHNDNGEKYPGFDGCELIFSNAKIYSVREQIELPLKIPKCDLFWSPHFNIPLGPIRAKKRLVTIHDVFFLAYSSHLSIHKKTYARIFYDMAIKKSDHVITDSGFSVGEIKKHTGVDLKKITPISLGVDTELFSSRIQGEMKGIPLTYLLYVGNLAIHKNIDRLIQSLDYLPKDIHLVLAGKEGEWDGWKKEFEKRKDRITVCGKVSDNELAWLYQNAEVLVHPSYYEGFGITPLEAMSAGCPVVVSKAASLPEVCGDAAVYIDPFCIKDIARGISEVWRNEQKIQELKDKGYERVKLFDWDRSALKHIEVIDQLIHS